jgi:hypothetical protein
VFSDDRCYLYDGKCSLRCPNSSTKDSCDERPNQCIWVKSPPGSESGSCNAVVADCSAIPGKDMCLTTGAAGSKTCFWLSDTGIVTYGGKCRDKADSNLQCSDVADTSECTGGTKLGGTALDGKCGVYNERCETRCDKLTNVTTETCAARGAHLGDCFEVKKGDGTFKECIDRVC